MYYYTIAMAYAIIASIILYINENWKSPLSVVVAVISTTFIGLYADTANYLEQIDDASPTTQFTVYHDDEVSKSGRTVTLPDGHDVEISQTYDVSNVKQTIYEHVTETYDMDEPLLLKMIDYSVDNEYIIVKQPGGA